MESWIADALNRLSRSQNCGYRADAPTAAEPAALAAMALVAHQQPAAAGDLCNWLAQRQSPLGSVGINATEADPCWPTSLAILAWRSIDTATEPSIHARETSAASRWLLRVAGEPVERSHTMGHDTTLIGWPWVLGTHSWIEPTAWAVVALKATGHTQHPRTREAVALLIDRLLPTGGCNYGNTAVLGQQLRPHWQPTGITLLALVGERDPAGRIEASLDYLARTLTVDTPAASLAYGVLGLTAFERRPPAAEQYLAAAYERLVGHEHDPLRLALLLLAAAGTAAPPITLVTLESGSR